MSERLISQKILLEAVGYGSKGAELEAYNVIQKCLSAYRFKFFITITSAKPLTDYITVVEVNRKIRQFMTRRLFGRRWYLGANLKFVFFIERHAESHRFQNRFHIHLLLTEPAHSREQFENLLDPEKEMKMYVVLQAVLKRIKSIRQFPRFQDPTFDPESVFKPWNKPERSFRNAGSSDTVKQAKLPQRQAKESKLRHFYIDCVHDQENLGDYLLKTLRSSPEDLMAMIDVENSDLNFKYK